MEQYTILMERRNRTTEYTGTVEELTKKFSYTLLKGAGYQHERGNKKINQHPKTIKALVTNLNNAESNAAANGLSCVTYRLQEA